MSHTADFEASLTMTMTAVVIASLMASLSAGYPSRGDVERKVNCKDQTASEGPCSIKYKVSTCSFLEPHQRNRARGWGRVVGIGVLERRPVLPSNMPDNTERRIPAPPKHDMPGERCQQTYLDFGFCCFSLTQFTRFARKWTSSTSSTRQLPRTPSPGSPRPAARPNRRAGRSRRRRWRCSKSAKAPRICTETVVPRIQIGSKQGRGMPAATTRILLPPAHKRARPRKYGTVRVRGRQFVLISGALDDYLTNTVLTIAHFSPTMILFPTTPRLSPAHRVTSRAAPAPAMVRRAAPRRCAGQRQDGNPGQHDGPPERDRSLQLRDPRRDKEQGQMQPAAHRVRRGVHGGLFGVHSPFPPLFLLLLLLLLSFLLFF